MMLYKFQREDGVYYAVASCRVEAENKVNKETGIYGFSNVEKTKLPSYEEGE